MKLEWKSCFRAGVTVFVTFRAIHYWSGLMGFVGMLFRAANALIIGCAIAFAVQITLVDRLSHGCDSLRLNCVQALVVTGPCQVPRIWTLPFSPKTHNKGAD